MVALVAMMHRSWPMALLMLLVASPVAGAHEETRHEEAPRPHASQGAPNQRSEVLPPPMPTAPPDAAPDAPPSAPTSNTNEELLPPELLESIALVYPPGAPPLTQAVTVRVRLTVDTAGIVTQVELIQGFHPVVDQLVLDTVKRFRFRPARYRGEAVAIEIDYEQTFAPPPPQDQEAPQARLRGVVTERGTRTPIEGATVVATSTQEPSHEQTTETDAEGRFQLDLPPGSYRIKVVHLGHEIFHQSESLSNNETLDVRYLMRRETYDPYETEVRTRLEREEVARITLQGREIHHLPGSFGDPFRVIDTLPGVQQASGMGTLPVVRGAGPGSSGTLLDGLELPALYHLLYGPAVIHPQMIEQVDFYPGAYGARFGGYTGGVTNGRTRFARGDENRYELDLSLVQTGAFVRQSIDPLDTTITAAGRIGYPGVFISLAAPTVDVSYYDYQTKIDIGSRQLGASVLVMGAFDEIRTETMSSLDPLDPTASPTPTWRTVLQQHFHRADARFWHMSPTFRGEYRLAGGFAEALVFAGTRGSWSLEPRAEWRWQPLESLTLAGGLQGRLLAIEERPPLEDNDFGGTRIEAFFMREFTQRAGNLYHGGAWLEIDWRPWERLQITPGVRGDMYQSSYGFFGSIDPRLGSRLKVVEGEDVSAWLKLGTGWYHQPPRLPQAFPGPEFPTDVHQLGASWHNNLGAEVEIAQAFNLELQGYFNYLDRVYAELYAHPTRAQILESSDLGFASSRETISWRGRVGRTYGVEALVRKRDDGHLFGWLSYSYSRSERLIRNQWVRYDFSREHRLQAVVGARFAGDWELSVRAAWQSAQPVTTIFGYNEGLGRDELRVDLRIDKRVVWNDFLLDFYIEIANAGLGRETLLITGEQIRLLLPSFGLRAAL